MTSLRQISPMLEGAVGWASREIAVFPCSHKVPLTPDGFKSASWHAEQVIEWWTKTPDAQIGIPTGELNHLFVVDVDGPEGERAAQKMNLPETFTVLTRQGRWQFWFRQPEGMRSKCTASVLAPQLDTRGDGGYVIAPPSIHHQTHKPYRVVKDLPWAPAPIELLEPQPAPRSSNGNTIPQGQRHRTMLSIAGALRARGLSREVVLAELESANMRLCVPPLDAAEIQKLADFVGSKPAGFRGSQPMETTVDVELECFREVSAAKVHWVWPKRIPVGFLTLFVGDAGRGKSLGSINVAATVSRGGSFPDGSPAPLGDTIFLSAEDDAAQTIRPRLDIAGADVNRVHRVKSVKVTLADGSSGASMFNLDRDLEKLRETIAKNSAVKVLVIDPLSAYLGSRIDAHKDADVRRVLSPLSELAAQHSLAIIGIMHLRKSDSTALLRVSGSIGFAAAARVVWGFGKNPIDDGPCMVPIKNNLAPLGDAISYSIQSAGEIPRIVWGSNVKVSADEVLSGELRDRRTSRRNDAEEWLRELLADGPMPQSQIEDRAEKAGFSWATIRRAKGRAKIKSTRGSFGGPWIWEAEDAQK